MTAGGVGGLGPVPPDKWKLKIAKIMALAQSSRGESPQKQRSTFSVAIRQWILIEER